MSEKCKHPILDKKGSTWDRKVYRNCQLNAVTENGYCRAHDPENIAIACARESQREIIEDLREACRKEEAAVGLFMRLHRNQEFESIISGIKAEKEARRYA